MDAPSNEADPAARRIYRHGVIVRVTHWVNVVCLAVLLTSGLQIFNAHPALYWGDYSDFDHPVLAIDAQGGVNGGPARGVTRILGHAFDTTGVLGLTAGPAGALAPRAFPAWITAPPYQDLATGRHWHFLFAWLFVLNGAVYLLSGFASGHFLRDLLPSRDQMRHVGRSILDHARLRFPRGEAARDYNVLQKLAYLAVVFLLLPVMVLAGLSLSPALNAAFPWLPALFDGRQSARTVHFIFATLIVLFVLVHVAMVLLSGPWNNIRAMVTGRYNIDGQAAHGGDD